MSVKWERWYKTRMSGERMEWEREWAIADSRLYHRNRMYE